MSRYVYILISVTVFILPQEKQQQKPQPMLCSVLRVKHHPHDGVDFVIGIFSTQTHRYAHRYR